MYLFLDNTDECTLNVQQDTTPTSIFEKDTIFDEYPRLEENWRGVNPPVKSVLTVKIPKARKIKNYAAPLRDFVAQTRSQTKNNQEAAHITQMIVLLSNKFNYKKEYFFNLCAINSLAHGFQFLAVDHLCHFQNFNFSSFILELINLTKKKVTNAKINSLVAHFLKTNNLLEQPLEQNASAFDCATNISSLYEKIETFASITRNCDHHQCESLEIKLLKPEMHDYHNFNTNLNAYVLKPRNCANGHPTTVKLGELLAVEFFFHKDFKQICIPIELSSFQTQLTVLDQNYSLVFFINMEIGSTENTNHYNVFLKNSLDKKFTLVDDLNQKILTNISEKTVRPQICFYAQTCRYFQDLVFPEFH